LVASNSAEGHLWWIGFAEFVDDAERRKAIFGFERKGLTTMMPTVADHSGTDLGQSSAEVFVDACHAAWRRRLGALLDRAKKEHLNVGDLIGREFEGQRIAFARCKNSTTLRAAVTDFWARGGRSLGPLQAGWRDVLPLLGEAHWQEGRDLALLALASYSPATKEEAAVFETATATVNAVGAEEDPTEE
jgi:CRISPR-associated protein Cas8a1/Csx13